MGFVFSFNFSSVKHSKMCFCNIFEFLSRNARTNQYGYCRFSVTNLHLYIVNYSGVINRLKIVVVVSVIVNESARCNCKILSIFCVIPFIQRSISRVEYDNRAFYDNTALHE